MTSHYKKAIIRSKFKKEWIDGYIKSNEHPPSKDAEIGFRTGFGMAWHFLIKEQHNIQITELTEEQLEKVLVKIDEELELYVMRNYVDEIIGNLRISLQQLNKGYSNHE